jgi:DNA-binding IscR family transcriptional regulator
VTSSSRFAVATHVLLALSLHPGERLSSSFLASTVNTNPVVIRRLLGALQRAGLIVTASGKAGGTELALSPSAITLRDVYEAVSGGEVFALSPSPPNRHCPLSCSMKGVLLPVFASAEAALAERLACTTLSSLAAQVSAVPRAKARKRALRASV